MPGTGEVRAFTVEFEGCNPRTLNSRKQDSLSAAEDQKGDMSPFSSLAAGDKKGWRAVQQRSPLHTEHDTLKPKPAAVNPKTQTPNPKSPTSNPQPQTLNPKPQTPNPEPYTLHPKP